MAVHSFDPKDVIIVIGGAPMQGFVDGEFVSFERTEDAFSTTAGADGDVTRVKSNNKIGILTLTLDQTSISNDILSAFAQLDEKSNAGIVPIIIKEINGTTTVFSGTGWVMKMPVLNYGKETSPREWAITVADAEVFIGGNLIN